MGKTPIYVFQDGAKQPSDKTDTEMVKKIIDEKLSDFKFQYFQSPLNQGLSRSILTGLDMVFENHASAIVLEDDLEVSPNFLDFMNEALKQYENVEKVFHISAYQYPLHKWLDEDIHFLREPNSWGWGTWRESWEFFQEDAAQLHQKILESEKGDWFTYQGQFDFLSDLKNVSEGKLDSWAVRWFASMVLQDGYSLYPQRSLIKNHGFDGSGVNCNLDETLISKCHEFRPKSWPTFQGESHSFVTALSIFRSFKIKKAFPFSDKVWDCITNYFLSSSKEEATSSNVASQEPNSF